MQQEDTLAGKQSAGGAPVYDDEFKLRAVTLYEATGSLANASKQLGISKSTLSRWANEQHIGSEIVVAAKEIATEVRRDIGDQMHTLLGKIVTEVDRRFDEGAYSSYELVVMAGIFADKHVALKKMTAMDDAKNVVVNWPEITPLTQEQIELERERVRLEYEAKQNQLEE